SAWRRFADAIRQCVGLKPLHLAERFAEAKVRLAESEADAVLLKARAQYELSVAKVREIELGAEGKYATDMAVARLIESLNPEDAANMKAMLDGKGVSVEVALEAVEAIAQRIRLHGGTVEVRAKPDE